MAVSAAADQTIKWVPVTTTITINDVESTVCNWVGNHAEDMQFTIQETRGKVGATFTHFTVHFTSSGVDLNTAWPTAPAREVDFTGEVRSGRVEKEASTTATIDIISQDIIDWSADSLVLSTTLGGAACTSGTGANFAPYAEATVTLFGRDDSGNNITLPLPQPVLILSLISGSGS